MRAERAIPRWQRPSKPSREMNALNRARVGQPELSIGIALHAGEVMYGNIG